MIEKPMTLAFNNVYHEDCLIGLKKIIPESVDLILTDPPFGIDFHKVGNQYNRKQKDLGKEYFEIAKEDYFEFTLKWLKASWDIMKPTASGFIFSGWNRLGDILNALEEVGFRLINHVIWKYQFGVFTRNKFVTSHYHILYFTKLSEKDDHLRTFNRIPDYSSSPGKMYFEDVWRINRDYQKGGEKTPTRLPLEVTDKCVRIGSNEGDLVLEPFLGSGSIILSCIRYKRQYIGFEISKRIYNIAVQRINQMKKEIESKTNKLDNWLVKKD